MTRSLTTGEFEALRKRVTSLRDGVVRAETERDQLEREVSAAQFALTELGFDLDGDLEEQLAALRVRAEERLGALEALLP